MRSIMWLLAAISCTAAAQESQAIFRAESNLATVSFHVLQKGLPLDNLSAEDVVLLVDGVPAKIAFFQGPATKEQPAPIELIMLVDRHRLDPQQASAAEQFERWGLTTPALQYWLEALPNAVISIYACDDTLERLAPPTRNLALLTAALQDLADPNPAWEKLPLQLPEHRKDNREHKTWIYESVASTIKDSMAAPGERSRILLVVSNGLSGTTSQPEDAARVAKSAGVPVYPVTVGYEQIVQWCRKQQQWNADLNAGIQKRSPTAPVGDFPLTQLCKAELSDMERLASLGSMTGGKSYLLARLDPQTLREMMGLVVKEAASRYVVGVAVPASKSRPVVHKLEVRLASKTPAKITGGKRDATY